MEAEVLGELIPLAGIAMIICIVVIPIWLKFHYGSQDRKRLHDTVRMLLDKGQPVSSELLASLNEVTPRRLDGLGPSNDMRRGVILVTVALALAALGLALYYVSDGYATGPIVGVAAFPGFIGLGFIVMALISGDKPKA